MQSKQRDEQEEEDGYSSNDDSLEYPTRKNTSKKGRGARQYEEEDDYDGTHENGPVNNYCCDLKQIHCEHVVIAVIVTLLVGCVVALFLVDSKTKPSISGIISLLFLSLIIYLCCYRRGKKNSKVVHHQIITHNHIVHNHNHSSRYGPNKGGYNQNLGDEVV